MRRKVVMAAKRTDFEIDMVRRMGTGAVADERSSWGPGTRSGAQEPIRRQVRAAELADDKRADYRLHYLVGVQEMVRALMRFDP